MGMSNYPKDKVLDTYKYLNNSGKYKCSIAISSMSLINNLANTPNRLYASSHIKLLFLAAAACHVLGYHVLTQSQ